MPSVGEDNITDPIAIIDSRGNSKSASSTGVAKSCGGSVATMLAGRRIPQASRKG